MTDDGSQPSIEQLATAVHRGSAPRWWSGPLLLVLLGGVVMLFSACCLMSSIFGVSYGEHQTSEILIQLLIVEVSSSSYLSALNSYPQTRLYR